MSNFKSKEWRDSLQTRLEELSSEQYNKPTVFTYRGYTFKFHRLQGPWKIYDGNVWRTVDVSASDIAVH